MPLISIITPVYNAARWLPETLASVRAQTLADWEQILVDDGSTDDSVAIVEAAAREDARFRLLRTQSNMGPSVARNLAIDAARGRFSSPFSTPTISGSRKSSPVRLSGSLRTATASSTTTTVTSRTKVRVWARLSGRRRSWTCVRCIPAAAPGA